MNIFCNKSYVKKRAFTLVEVMLLLVVLSLIFASSAAVITRKHKLKPRKSVHGIYVCYRDNDTGLLREAMYSGKTKLFAREQAAGDDTFECTFESPKNVSYLYVQLIGGGGAGGNANQPTSDFYSYTYTGLTAPGNGFTEESYSTPLSFIKDMDASESFLKYASSSQETGLTADYIHSFKEDNKTFSVRALRKFFTDHDLKFIVYDHLGRGNDGATVKHEYFTENTEIADKRASDAEPVRWYKSTCQGYHSTWNPADCLAAHLRDGANIKVGGSDKFFKYTLSSTYGVGEYEAGSKTYCQYREPLSENCPWIKALMIPNEADEDDAITCPGQPAGAGGLVSSTLRPFDLGYTYKRGRRGELAQDEALGFTGPSLGPHSYILACKVGINIMNGSIVSMDYGTSKAGVLLKKDEADPDNDGVYKDIHGETIVSPTFTDDFVRSNEGLYSSTLSNQFQSYYFKTFPTANYKFELTMSGPCANTSSFKTDGKYIGLDGEDGGALPYFGTTIETGQKTTNSGIKLCENSSCILFGKDSNVVSVAPEMISQSITISKGGKGAIMDKGAIDGQFLKTDKNVCETPSGSASGSDTTWRTPSSPYKDICSVNLAFRYKLLANENEHLLELGRFDNLSSHPSNGYSCPYPQLYTKYSVDTVANIGLLVNHYSGNMKLYYGEKGRAGTHKPFFTRSFGTSKLLMNPGRGGVAFKSINYRTSRGAEGSTVPDVAPENKNTSTDNFYGRNGSETLFGTDCVKKSTGGTGNGDDYDCAISITTPGGGGGRTHVEDLQEIETLTNEEIYHLAKDTTLSPELQSKLIRYSSNYTPDDPINSPHIGELSGFQEISYLSDLSVMDNGEFLANLGRGGNGGYIEHKCFLRPQYFVYQGRGMDTYSSESYKFSPGSNSPIAIDNVDNTSSDGYTEWEGYTNLTQGIINKACGLSSTDIASQVLHYLEYEPTDGYPGAVVIMW